VIIGVPKEIKPQENRVGLVPAAAGRLVQDGHTVRVQAGAGEGSGLTDAEYAAAGADVVPEAADAWSADMVWKVKEPIAPEYPLLRQGQILFTFLHLAPDRAQTDALLEAGTVGIAYETIKTPAGELPLLDPMSEVAGRLAVQAGAWCLEKAHGGRGVLLGGVPGVPPADVVVIGAGTVGRNAVQMAVGLGASVTVLDIDLPRLRTLDARYGGRLRTLYSTAHTIEAAVRRADLLVGAVLVPGAKAPHLVSAELVAQMGAGTAIVDVAIDQGGCVQTSRPTTHAEPTFLAHDVVHYSVANMPGAVPRTSTFALQNATLPHGRRIAALGWQEAVRRDPILAGGVNVVGGQVVHPGVAEAHELPLGSLPEGAQP